MDINFFKKTRILDGGMGQELLARGMEPNGTLWSANALLQDKYHQLLLDTHLDFIKAGAEVIVTTTFTTRKTRLKDNGVEIYVCGGALIGVFDNVSYCNCASERHRLTHLSW